MKHLARLSLAVFSLVISSTTFCSIQSRLIFSDALASGRTTSRRPRNCCRRNSRQTGDLIISAPRVVEFGRQ